MSTTFTGWVAFGYRLYINSPEDSQAWVELAEDDIWAKNIDIIQPGEPMGGNGQFYAVTGKIKVWDSYSLDGPDVLRLNTGRGQGSTILMEFMEEASGRGLEGSFYPEDYPDWVYWLEVR